MAQSLDELIAKFSQMEEEEQAKPKQVDTKKYPYVRQFISGTDTLTMPQTRAELMKQMVDREKERKPYSKKMPDGTVIEGKTIKDLESQVSAYNKLMTPKKKESVDESAKRDKWLKEYMAIQKNLDTGYDVPVIGEGVPEDSTKFEPTLDSMQQEMFKNQQSALTDSVNYSLGREASKSPQNWKNFLKETGLQEEANKKYEKFLGEVKLGKHGKAFAPGQEIEMATELTNQYINKILKEKYGIEQ